MFFFLFLVFYADFQYDVKKNAK